MCVKRGSPTEMVQSNKKDIKKSKNGLKHIYATTNLDMELLGKRGLKLLIKNYSENKLGL